MGVAHALQCAPERYVPPDHSSDTIWKEITDCIAEAIDAPLVELLQKSQVCGMSFDTKGRDLAIVVHYLHAHSESLEFRSLPLSV